MTKRVGLLIDSNLVSKQINDFIQLTYKAKNYKITTLVINNVDRNPKNLFTKIHSYILARGLAKALSTALFKVICKIESLVIKRMSKFVNFYEKYQLFDNDYEVINVTPEISKSGLIYRYTDPDLKLIQDANLDLMIRAGSGILRGPILNICPKGIISFHHADNDINRGGPPGFWEVYDRNPRTGFIIQILKDELDGGDVLYKGFIPTNWFYSLNLAKLYEMSYPFLHYVIEDITSENPTLGIQKKSPYYSRLYTTPSVFQTGFYLLKTAKVFFGKVTKRFTGRGYRWGVAYQFTERWDDVTLSRSIKIPNPKNRFLADPFVIKRHGAHFCFVEDYDYKTKRGCISVYKITNEFCKELGVALAESFHLSYPFLFEYQNEMYMCPETSEKNEIRLYKCEDFPMKWTFHKTIMKQVSAADTIIFPHGGKWWLFTNIDGSPVRDHSCQLHIFYSSNPLTDNWIPHNRNPLIFDPLKARNGGLIIDEKGYFRVYQRQGFDLYCEALGVAKIKTLTKDAYIEEPMFKVDANFFRSIQGTHTYNFSEGLLVFDFVEVSKYNTGIVSKNISN